MIRDNLGDRMKGYEDVTRHTLTRRTSVIVRVDGVAFHTFTRNWPKPFSEAIRDSMLAGMLAVVRGSQNCKLCYQQSDECSFLFLDTDTLETQPWFGNGLSKIISVTASLFTAGFNSFMSVRCPESKMATFDARAFNIPESDVTNYFLWRAKDWLRNSVQSLAQHHFSAKDLYGKKRKDQLAMLRDIGVEWSDLPDRWKYGTLYTVKDSIQYHVDPVHENINTIVRMTEVP